MGNLGSRRGSLQLQRASLGNLIDTYVRRRLKQRRELSYELLKMRRIKMKIKSCLVRPLLEE